jgi:hypothetical protein
LTSPSDQKFDGNGNAVPAAASLNKSFTWRDVLSSQSPVQREALRALLQATPAIKETDLAGSVTADASTVTSAVVPILFWGVTDRLSFGLAVPVEHVDVRAVSGYVQGPSAQTLIDRACASSSPVKCQQIAQQLNQTLNTRLTQMGYEPLHSMTTDALGDVRLFARYSLFRGEKQALALKPMIVFPTGTAPDYDRLADTNTGDGRYEAGTTLVYELTDGGSWRGNVYSMYQALLPTHPLMHIPTASSWLSGDRETVNQSWDHRFGTGIGVTYTVASWGTSLGAGYNLQYQTGSSFSGSLFGADRYALLGDLYPDQWLHSATITLGFNTFRWYRQGSFPMPIEAALTYDKALGGRNTMEADIFAADITVFL